MVLGFPPFCSSWVALIAYDGGVESLPIGFLCRRISGFLLRA